MQSPYEDMLCWLKTYVFGQFLKERGGRGRKQSELLMNEVMEADVLSYLMIFIEFRWLNLDISRESPHSQSLAGTRRYIFRHLPRLSESSAR